jgi:hypothetical protein
MNTDGPKPGQPLRTRIFEELAELSQAAAIHGLEAANATLLARRWRPWLDAGTA